MRAVVTKEFKGLADGDISERYFVEGEVVYGDLAARAVAEGCAKEDHVEDVVAPGKRRRKSK